MTTAFHLTPADNRFSSLHLVIEIGWYGVAFAWYTRDPFSLQGAYVYNFPDASVKGIDSSLRTIFKREKILNNSFSSVSVFYNFHESLLVPRKYYHESRTESELELIYGKLINSDVHTDTVDFKHGIGTDDIIYNVHAIPSIIHESFNERFPGCRFLHSTTAQLADNPSLNEIHCIIYHNTIKVLLFNNRQLCLVQQFRYLTPEDVAYHLLNCCDKFDVAVKDVQLTLSGMIDVDSNLYQELYKYFLNIRFDIIDDDIFLAKTIKEFPAHFFSPLMQLARCAS